MMQHVNSVFVSNAGLGTGSDINALAINTVFAAIINADGEFVIADATTAADAKVLYVGLVTGKNTITDEAGTVTTVSEVQYSKPIQKGSVSSMVLSPNEATVEETSVINFGSLVPEIGYSYTLRLIRRDLYEHPAYGVPYSYTYFAQTTNLADMINYFAKKVNKDTHNGITATPAAATLTLTAQPKTDSEGLHPANLYSQIIFDAYVYLSLPSGLLTTAQYGVPGLTITKTPGTPGKGNAKIVRDREDAALAYRGILYRQNGIWPYVAPELNVDLNKTYDTLVIEYDNLYRSNDNQYQKTTPLAIEVYTATDAATGAEELGAILTAFASGTTPVAP